MSECNHDTINALDNFWAYDCPSCGRTVSGPTYVTLLREQVTTLKAEREWVSVEERLPDRSASRRVLIYTPRYGVEEGYWSGDYFHIENGEQGPTHWRPLPPAPEGE